MRVIQPAAARPFAVAFERVTGKSIGVAPVLAMLLGLSGAAYLAVFVLAGLFRMLYPYPLDLSTEGAGLQQVEALLHGQSLYSAPTLQHVPLIYGPVYFYVAALPATVLGAGFLPLRLVSLLASVGSLSLLYLLVRRETGSRVAGVVAAGLLTACNPVMNGVMDEGRVDALLLLFTLAAIFVMRAADHGWWPRTTAIVVCGCLCALALLTKQAAIPVVGALTLYLALVDRKRVAPFVLVVGMLVAVPVLLLYHQSGDWALFYLWVLPNNHEVRQDLITRFLTLNLLPPFTLALLVMAPLFFVGRFLRGDRRTALFYGLACGSLLVTSWLTSSNVGGGGNVLLPGYAAVALLFGLGLPEGLRLLDGTGARLATFRSLLLAWGVLQMLILLYNPRLAVPYRSDLWADDRLESTLAALPGPIFAPDFDAFLRDTDKGEQPYSGAAAELVGGFGGHTTPVGGQWTGEVGAALTAHQFNYVILVPENGSTFFIHDAAVAAGYTDAGALFPEGDKFWLWRSGLQPHAEIYVAPNMPRPVLPP